MTHILFYDESCPFCQRMVARIKQLDSRRIFQYEPLTSPKLEEKYRPMNTLVLLENYGAPKQRTWIRGRGALRLFWLLGGWWQLLGILCFLPIGADLVYR